MLEERSNPETSLTAGDWRRDRAIPPPMASRPMTVTFMMFTTLDNFAINAAEL
jgi:hypothetical protein